MKTLTSMLVSALLALSSPLWAQSEPDQDQDRTRERAMDTLRQQLAEHPNDADFQYAFGCIGATAPCDDEAALNRAMERIRARVQSQEGEAHEGLGYALQHLERNREQLRQREQAKASIREQLGQHPDDPGLRQALRCMEAGPCEDPGAVEQAMNQIRAQQRQHPDDAGLQYAFRHLEQHRAMISHGMDMRFRPERPTQHR